VTCGFVQKHSLQENARASKSDPIFYNFFFLKEKLYFLQGTLVLDFQHSISKPYNTIFNKTNFHKLLLFLLGLSEATKLKIEVQRSPYKIIIFLSNKQLIKPNQFTMRKSFSYKPCFEQKNHPFYF